MEETKKVIDLTIDTNQELVKMLNSMCLGAYDVQLGDLLKELQNNINNGNLITWKDFPKGEESQ